MKTLKRIDKGLVDISRGLLTVTVITEMIIVFAGAVARYVFNNSLAWVDELAGYLLILVTCFGCHVSFYEKSLAAVTVFVDILPFHFRKLFRTIANFGIIILLSLLTVLSAQLCMQSAIVKTSLPALHLPMVWFYIVLPIVSVFMGYHALLVMIEELLSENTKEKGDVA